jgi:hypothetical protein
VRYAQPTLSGFHKASVHLYVTLLGLGESTGANKEIVVRHRKQKPPAKPGTQTDLLGEEEEGAGGGEEGKEVPDFDERLALRLQQAEEAAAVVRAAEGHHLRGATHGRTSLTDCVAHQRSSHVWQVPDEVRFGESGWKERYYTTKLHAPKSDESVRRYVVKTYVQGLCWVLMYYYQGVQDWGWFYPFHYAPCASDLVDLDEFSGGQFDIGEPFTCNRTRLPPRLARTHADAGRPADALPRAYARTRTHSRTRSRAAHSCCCSHPWRILSRAAPRFA